MPARFPLFVIIALGAAVSASAQTTSSRPSGALVTNAFPAEARVAYIDIDRVAALSLAGKESAAKIENLRSKRGADLSERSRVIAALEQKVAQAGVLNDDARIRLQREYQRARVNFDRLRDDIQTEVQELQEDLLRAFTARVFPVVAEVAGERKLWAVFSGEANLLWHDPALDLSEEVARRLDAKPVR